MRSAETRVADRLIRELLFKFNLADYLYSSWSGDQPIASLTELGPDHQEQAIRIAKALISEYLRFLPMEDAPKDRTILIKAHITQPDDPGTDDVPPPDVSAGKWDPNLRNWVVLQNGPKENVEVYAALGWLPIPE